MPQEADRVTAAMSQALPQDPDTHAARARRAEYHGCWSAAAAEWQGFLRRCAEDRRAATLARRAWCQAQYGDLGAATRTLQAAEPQAETRLGAARIASAFAADATARATWQSCLTQDPDRIEGFLGLARLHLRRARLDEAETLLDHTRKVWPGSAAAAALWARAADERGDTTGAVSRWRQVFARHAASRAGLLPFARHAGLLGDRAALDRLLAAFAPDPHLHGDALLQYHLAAEDLGAACAVAREAVLRAPDEPALRLRHARVLMRLGAPPAMSLALEELQQVWRIAPGSAEAAPLLASTLIAIGAPAAAWAVIRALPPERDDPAAQGLRLWDQLNHEGETDGQRYWRDVLVSFGLAPDDGLLTDLAPWP